MASLFRPLGEQVTAEVVEEVALAHSSMRIDRAGTMPQVFGVTCYEFEDPAFGATLLGHIAALRGVHFSRIHQITADPKFTVQERDATSLPASAAQESHLYQIALEEQAPDGTGWMAYQMTIATAPGAPAYTLSSNATPCSLRTQSNTRRRSRSSLCGDCGSTAVHRLQGNLLHRTSGSTP